MTRKRTWTLGLAYLMAAASGVGAQAAPATSVPLYKDLGAHGHGVSTRVPMAQRYFDQGLRLYYAFNHAEAIRAFDEAARLDPRCAMCYWGAALAYGPNINASMDSASGVAAYASVKRALAASTRATPRERALIRALAQRYTPVPPAQRSALDSAYSRAMRQVAERFPRDPETRTLYAESVMDLSPWNYWERNGSPRPQTRELIAHLERVMAISPTHPGAHHFFIHAVEAVEPERAVPVAERLASLMPGAGHLVHMPGHIYIRVGRYVDAVKANEHAVHADEAYIQNQRPTPGAYEGGYYPHNYDFLAFAASMIGRGRQSIAAAEKLIALSPDSVQRAPGMTILQHNATRHLQLKARFGKWDDILASPAPAEDLPHARAMSHYARGRALVARGDLTRAEFELAQLRSTASRSPVKDHSVGFNPSSVVLDIATEVLAGHVAALQKDYPRAERHLRDAASREDALVYGEPPEWTVPVRQDLGSVLLEAGRPTDAERSFREDLKRFPENGWSLHGLARALRAQGRNADADAVMERFRRIWSTADMQITEGGRVSDEGHAARIRPSR